MRSFPIKTCLAMAFFLVVFTTTSHAQAIFGDGFEGSNTATVVEVTVTGMSDHTAVTATLNSGESLRFSTDGSRSFSTLVPHGDTYTVTLTQQGGSTTCQLGSNANGTAAGSKVTVEVNCGEKSLWDVMHWDEDNWE